MIIHHKQVEFNPEMQNWLNIQNESDNVVNEYYKTLEE